VGDLKHKVSTKVYKNSNSKRENADFDYIEEMRNKHKSGIFESDIKKSQILCTRNNCLSKE